MRKRLAITLVAAAAIAFAGAAPAVAQSSLSSSAPTFLTPAPSQPESWDDPLWGEQRSELHDQVADYVNRWGFTVEEPYGTISQDVADRLVKGLPSGISAAVREHGGDFSIEQYDNEQLGDVIAEYKADESTYESEGRPVGVGVAGNQDVTLVVVFLPNPDTIQ